MKEKIKSFIKTILTMAILIGLCFVGIFVYNEINKTNIVSEVQQFVSNITTTEKIVKNENVSEKIELSQESVEKVKESFNSNTIQTNKYFYNQLEYYPKMIYDMIEENEENMKSGTYEVDLGTKFYRMLSNNDGQELFDKYYQSAIIAYIYDKPEIFYIDFSKLYWNIETTTKGSEKTYRVFLNSGENNNYLTEEFSSKEMVNKAINQIEEVREYFVQNKKNNNYENIKMVHDYLVESIDYEQTISESNIYNIYGALINKRCVCEGYAESFKYLMEALNIPCTIIVGEASYEGSSEEHAWNYVQLNDIWYGVDCTWDDPIIIGPGFLSNSLKYKYFLKGESEFRKTHVPNGQFIENGEVFEFPSLSQIDY